MEPVSLSTTRALPQRPLAASGPVAPVDGLAASRVVETGLMDPRRLRQQVHTPGPQEGSREQATPVGAAPVADMARQLQKLVTPESLRKELLKKQAEPGCTRVDLVSLAVARLQNQVYSERDAELQALVRLLVQELQQAPETRELAALAARLVPHAERVRDWVQIGNGLMECVRDPVPLARAGLRLTEGANRELSRPAMEFLAERVPEAAPAVRATLELADAIPEGQGVPVVRQGLMALSRHGCLDPARSQDLCKLTAGLMQADNQLDKGLLDPAAHWFFQALAATGDGRAAAELATRLAQASTEPGGATRVAIATASRPGLATADLPGLGADLSKDPRTLAAVPLLLRELGGDPSTRPAYEFGCELLQGVVSTVARAQVAQVLLAHPSADTAPERRQRMQEAVLALSDTEWDDAARLGGLLLDRLEQEGPDPPLAGFVKTLAQPRSFRQVALLKAALPGLEAPRPDRVGLVERLVRQAHSDDRLPFGVAGLRFLRTQATSPAVRQVIDQGLSVIRSGNAKERMDRLLLTLEEVRHWEEESARLERMATRPGTGASVAQHDEHVIVGGVVVPRRG